MQLFFSFFCLCKDPFLNIFIIVLQSLLNCKKNLWLCFQYPIINLFLRNFKAVWQENIKIEQFIIEIFHNKLMSLTCARKYQGCSSPIYHSFKLFVFKDWRFLSFIFWWLDRYSYVTKKSSFFSGKKIWNFKFFFRCYHYIMIN